MAVYPCSFGAHRYPQKQRAAYISLVDGPRPETRKHRLCPKHLELVLEQLQYSFTFIDEETQVETQCEICQAPGAGPLFVKVYAEDGDEPAQYVTDLCPDHRTQVLTDLHWREAIPVGA